MRYGLPSIPLRSASGAAPALLLVDIAVMLGASMLTGCFTASPKPAPPVAAAPPTAVYDTRPVVVHDLFAAPYRIGTDHAAR